ncbi:unnamed protein product [Owenia fusiformis]|uniref:UDP-N-acetylglucosamine--peptide N-acetylglucosaminyltransferase SPINDLY n=1 Tax=Owenia fusiformis TaxID=6347 RepID=A0A8S4N6U2_OWEFU|nr:unnamed protein product [Owenia fusiformis]
MSKQTEGRDVSGSFRYGSSRKMELTLRKELDDLTKKSMLEIAEMKAKQIMEQRTDAEETTRKLSPEFKHQKARKKLKSQPMFHPELQDRLPSPPAKPIPNVPPYNPLDKGEARVVSAKKTRSYPYTKPEVVTTTDLKKPKVSSVGVVPSRNTDEVQGLHVVMKGRSAIGIDDQTIDMVNQANKDKTRPTPRGPILGRPTEEAVDSGPKPALLVETGSVVSAPFGVRAKPQARPITELTTRTKKRPRAMPDDRVFRQYDDVIADIDEDGRNLNDWRNQDEVRSQASSTTSVKSAKELLEEAKGLTAAGADKIYMRHSKANLSPPGRKNNQSLNALHPKGSKSSKSRHDDSIQREKSDVRSVDEIIMALKVQSREGTVSEADRKIQEIMSRVMSSASAVLSDIGNRQVSDLESVNEEGPRPTENLAQMEQVKEKLEEVQNDEKTDIDDNIIEKQNQSEEKVPIPEIIIDNATVASTNEKPSEKHVRIEAPGDDTKRRRSSVTDAKNLSKVITSDLKEVPEIDQSGIKMKIDTDTGQMMIEPRVGEDFTFTDTPSPPGTPQVDQEQALHDLHQPKHVTYEDIVSIQAKTAALFDRPKFKVTATGKIAKPFVHENVASFLSAWKPTRKYELHEKKVGPDLERNIHHFCMTNEDIQLPKELRGTMRRNLVAGRYQNMNEQPEENDDIVWFHPTTPTSPTRLNTADALVEQEEERSHQRQRMSAAAKRILDNAKMEAPSGGQGDDETLEAWQARAQQLFDAPDISIEGEKMDVKWDESRMYWNPAPPKMDIAPARVKDHLFSDYHGAALAMETAATTGFLGDDEETIAEEEESVYEYADPEEMAMKERVLQRRYHSSRDLSNLEKSKIQREKDIEEGKLDEFGEPIKKENTNEPAQEERADPVSKKALSFVEMRRTYSMAQSAIDLMKKKKEEKREMTDQEIFPVFVKERRSQSCPNLLGEFEEFVMIPQDFNTAMEEVKRHKEMLQKVTTEKKLTPFVKPQVTIAEQIKDNEEQFNQFAMVSQKKDEKTPAELALEAGRNYVLLPKNKKSKVDKKKKRKVTDMARLEQIERFLKIPARPLQRSMSLPRVRGPIEYELRVPPQVRRRERGSVPDIFNFSKYAMEKGAKEGVDMREWTRDIWNEWFDLVFPENPLEAIKKQEEEDKLAKFLKLSGQTKKVEKVPETPASTIVSLKDFNLEDQTELDDTPEGRQIMEILLEEIQRLSALIESSDNPRPFDLSRRGAIYRKLGLLKKSQIDLDLAIDMEPLLIDAYWHRHMLYILQNNDDKALEDLQMILKHHKTHSGAYRSRAEIYKRRGDIMMAIINYSQALKFNPEDYESYYCRAEMYEENGDMLLALEDYAEATKLMPSKTDAILKHGLHYFNNKSWQMAINDFTQLLKQEPNNSEGRTYRGRAYAKIGEWNAAIEDLSAAIHLDPNNWLAFYHRGCLLRKLNQKKALQDLSQSILANESEENQMAFLHRGILYVEMNRYDEAIPDFEAVLRLNNQVSLAHLNLGLIYLQYKDDYQRAIRKFTSAIKVTPTFVRAYICRAEAYHKIHDIPNALLDYTRAIHLRPDVHHYYMMRGQMVLKLGNLELAAFCIRHASELGEGLGQSPTQQAIVQSFLKNYGKAIEILSKATRVKPIPPLFTLLGKMQMKNKEFEGAVESFNKALDLLKPWQDRDSWPFEAAEVNYLKGVSQMEMRQYNEAHDAFNMALKIDDKYAEAYYQRGLSRMRLKQAKGIQDFNRALALDPKIFQAYLSRAAYYGLRGQYSKAILNCNEAIKLQPKSVRAYLYRGALKFHIKAYMLAIRDLTEATKIDNQCSLAYFNRAVCYHESKDYAKALNDYGIVLLIGDQLLLKDRNACDKVLVNRGLLYFDRKDYKNALHDFLLAAKVCPWDQKIHHTLALCYHKLNRLEDAVKSFTKAIELDMFFLDAYIGRGNVFMDYGHTFGHMFAKNDYQRTLKLDPTCLQARVNLAYNLQVTGKFQLAWQQFTLAIEINPKFKPALEGRAIVNLQMSDTFAAYQDINTSVNISPTAELLTNRGVIHQYMNDRANAMRDYQSAIKLDATYSLAYFNSANVYFAMRQFKQAKVYYDKAIQFGDRDESAYLNRAITNVMLRDSNAAIEDFQQAIKLSPHSAHMYFNRANLYSMMKQYDLAEKDYTKALELQPDDALVYKRRADVRGKQGIKDGAISDYKRAIEIQSMNR